MVRKTVSNHLKLVDKQGLYTEDINILVIVNIDKVLINIFLPIQIVF